MQINEFIAETIVTKIAALVNKEVIFGDMDGTVLAATDLAKTTSNYSQLQKAAQSGVVMEISKEDFSFTKNPLGVGVIIPVAHQSENMGALYIQDEAVNYSKYLAVIKTTIDLMLHQTLVIDNVPYKDRIKDNFIFGLLHHKLSWDDPRTYDEAELLEVSLHKDKIVLIVNAPGFWQLQFPGNASASEDEKQSLLHTYKTKLFETMKQFFGLTGGVQVSYFGNDTWVILVDELANMNGSQMVETLRKKDTEFVSLVLKKLDHPDIKKVGVGVGNFYKGKDGIVLAYEEAKVALQLGSNFDNTRALYHIDDLGMIAILAGGNKRWQENFVKNLLTQLMPEKYLLETVEVFFNENMSLTLTAKVLNIHRNTLLYRLSKIKKITGLDPRNFNDAVKIKLASILNTMQEKERA